jgi:hypothetical protein
MDKPVCFFTDEDIAHFEKWIDLEVENITWEGRYIQQYEKFWSLFFEPGHHLRTYLEKVRFAVEYVKIGPLVSWFNWLQEKLICYCFVYKDVSVFQIARESGLDISEVCTTLRTFYVDRYSHLEAEINNFFSISNAVSENIYYKQEDFISRLSISDTPRGTLENETLSSLEITLYDEWKKLYDYMVNENADAKYDYEKIKEKENFKSQLNFVKEFLIPSSWSEDCSLSLL